jgi:uncharacterized OB-fold protein
VTKPLVPPRRKNPLKRTRLPVPPPEGRSRQAHLLTRAAAEGVFGLPACLDCGALHYPPRDACPECLSCRIGLTACSPLGTLAVATVVTASNSVYFRERSPWRTGLVVLDAGPGVVAHVHGDCLEGGRTRLEWRLDRGIIAARNTLLVDSRSNTLVSSSGARCFLGGLGAPGGVHKFAWDLFVDALLQHAHLCDTQALEALELACGRV